MTRASLWIVLAAGVGGAAWGASIPPLFGGFDEQGVLAEQGRWLAVAGLIGVLARRVGTGALAGLVFGLGIQAGMEWVPWDGVVEQAADAGLPRDDAEWVGIFFDAGTGLDPWIPVGTAAMGAGAALWHASGRARAVAVGLLAGALLADLVNRLPDPALDSGLALAGLQAGAGLALLARFGRPYAAVAAAAAVLPVALVWIPPHVFGTDVVGGVHPEVQIIR